MKAIFLSCQTSYLTQMNGEYDNVGNVFTAGDTKL